MKRQKAQEFEFRKVFAFFVQKIIASAGPAFWGLLVYFPRLFGRLVTFFRWSAFPLKLPLFFCLIREQMPAVTFPPCGFISVLFFVRFSSRFWASEAPIFSRARVPYPFFRGDIS